ncbi:sugar transferase [Sulfitobacter litoralis]|uniref:sugar transferase n=1 Tax=Sulfitobacter litoralis TaxID=335975 RepID=UPI002B2657AC|nr:sugar transferase [Sulfitobacter litoralis]
MAFIEVGIRRGGGPYVGRLLYHRVGKRLFDLSVSFVLLPLILLLIVLLCCYMAAHGQIGLYAHPRIGRAGKPFRCWKITTMVPNAQAALPAILSARPDYALEWALYQKLRNDPRVIPGGQFLRRTGLDELPQIWNVLRGDMSLVGPRPVTRSELHSYGDARGAYQSVRPGITGLWQVAGRGVMLFDERVTLDERYTRQMCFAGDLQIIARTLPVLLRPTGH